MANYYLDANTLQHLINSGTYADVLRTAASRGIRFATTEQIIIELRDGTPTAMVRDWLRSVSAQIEVVPNLQSYSPGQTNAGELSLLDWINLERSVGNNSSVLWTDEKKLIDNWRQSNDPAFRNAPLNRTFQSDIRGSVNSALDAVYAGDPVGYARACQRRWDSRPAWRSKTRPVMMCCRDMQRAPIGALCISSA